MTTLDYADELEVSSELLEIGLDPLVRLSRDLKRAAIELGDDEARYLVDYYYTWQEARKRNQCPSGACFTPYYDNKVLQVTPSPEIPDPPD